MSKQESEFLLSGYLYKLKAGDNSTFNPLSNAISLWVKRFVVVEERVTRAGKECFFSYYLDEKSANDVRAAKEAVPLQDIMHVSPLASGRMNLYMSKISKLDARSKGELLQHKDLIVEVEVPFRIYFLRAEGRADMLKWAAGLQRLSGLRVEAPWPVHLGPLPPIPALIIEHRKVSGTLPIEMYTTPIVVAAPSFTVGTQASGTNSSESPFAPIKHDLPMHADTTSASSTHHLPSSTKGIVEALSSSLSSSGSNHFEMPKTVHKAAPESGIKNPPTSFAKDNKKKELVIEGDTLKEEGKNQDQDEKDHSTSVTSRLGLIPLISLQPNKESSSGLTGTQSLLEGALAQAKKSDFPQTAKRNIKAESHNIVLPPSDDLNDTSSQRRMASSVKSKDVKRLGVLDDDEDDNDDVDYALMARARITTPNLPTSEDSKHSESSPVVQVVLEKAATYASPARPQTARGRGLRNEQENLKQVIDDSSPPVASALNEESTRPSSWMRGNDTGFRTDQQNQAVNHMRGNDTGFRTDQQNQAVNHVSSAAVTADDWDDKPPSQSQQQSHHTKKLSETEKARLKIGDPGVRRDEDILSSWD